MKMNNYYLNNYNYYGIFDLDNINEITSHFFATNNAFESFHNKLA